MHGTKIYDEPAGNGQNVSEYLKGILRKISGNNSETSGALVAALRAPFAALEVLLTALGPALGTLGRS